MVTLFSHPDSYLPHGLNIHKPGTPSSKHVPKWRAFQTLHLFLQSDWWRIVLTAPLDTFLGVPQSRPHAVPHGSYICCRLCLLRSWQEIRCTYFVSLEALCQEPYPLRMKTPWWCFAGLVYWTERNIRIPHWESKAERIHKYSGAQVSK